MQNFIFCDTSVVQIYVFCTPTILTININNYGAIIAQLVKCQTISTPRHIENTPRGDKWSASLLIQQDLFPLF